MSTNEKTTKCPTVRANVALVGSVSNAFWHSMTNPLEGLGEGAGADGWVMRHVEAVTAPRSGFEHAFVAMALALAEYADAHVQRYESALGEDGVLGREWEVMVRGLAGLLNGELGNLDGGTCDRSFRAMARAAGVELE